MAQLTEFLKEKLPTPLSRWVASVTLSIASVLLFLPEIAPKIGMVPIGPETLLLRLCLVATILFLGSFFILILLSKHIEKLNGQLDRLQRLNKAVSAFKELEASSDLLLNPQPVKGALSAIYDDNKP